MPQKSIRDNCLADYAKTLPEKEGKALLARFDAVTVRNISEYQAARDIIIDEHKKLFARLNDIKVKAGEKAAEYQEPSEPDYAGIDNAVKEILTKKTGEVKQKSDARKEEIEKRRVQIENERKAKQEEKAKKEAAAAEKKRLIEEKKNEKDEKLSEKRKKIKEIQDSLNVSEEAAEKILGIKFKSREMRLAEVDRIKRLDQAKTKLREQTGKEEGNDIPSEDWSRDVERFYSSGGNKAVNENGEPITMYHGSGTKADIKQFYDNQFFTPNDYIAENYAENQDGKTHKVYISTKNPLEISENKDRMDRYNGILVSGSDKKMIELLNNLYGGNAVKLYKGYGLTKGLGNIVEGNFEPLIKYAKENGFDSLKFKDVSFDQLISADTYLVFDGKNVKAVESLLGKPNKGAKDIWEGNGERIEEDKDTMLVDGIKNVTKNKQAADLLKVAMNRGVIPERLYNDFGKELAAIKITPKSKEAVIEVAEVISKYVDAKNEKTDGYIKEQNQAIENADFEKMAYEGMSEQEKFESKIEDKQAISEPLNDKELEFVNENYFRPKGYEFTKDWGLVKSKKISPSTKPLTEGAKEDIVGELGGREFPASDFENKSLITKIKEYATEVISNRKKIRRLSEQAERGRKQGGIRNVEATLLLTSGGSQSGQIKGREAQQKAIEDYAKSEGIWFDNIEAEPEIGSIDDRLGKYKDGGVENQVYIPIDNQSVVRKAMRTTDPFNKDNPNEVLYHLDTRISEHNAGIGNSVPYTVVGFGRMSNGDFVVITEQPHVQNARLAKDEEIKAEMLKMGYEQDGKHSFGDENHFIADVNPKNVLVDEKGNFHFIDTLYDILYKVNEDWSISDEQAHEVPASDPYITKELEDDIRNIKGFETILINTIDEQAKMIGDNMLRHELAKSGAKSVGTLKQNVDGNKITAGKDIFDALKRGEMKVTNDTSLFDIVMSNQASEQQKGVALALILADRAMGKDNFLANLTKKTGAKIIIRNKVGAPIMSANENGVISINADALGRRFVEINAESKFFTWAEAALYEEAIHLATFKVANEGEVEQIGRELGDSERAMVRAIYGADMERQNPDTGKMEPDYYHIGLEYVRMIVQNSINGTVTETFKPKSFASAFFAKMVKYLRDLFGKNTDSIANRVVNRLEVYAGIKKMEAAGKTTEESIANRPKVKEYEKTPEGKPVFRYRYKNREYMFMQGDWLPSGTAWFEVEKTGWGEWLPVGKLTSEDPYNVQGLLGFSFSEATSNLFARDGMGTDDKFREFPASYFDKKLPLRKINSNDILNRLSPEEKQGGFKAGEFAGKISDVINRIYQTVRETERSIEDIREEEEQEIKKIAKDYGVWVEDPFSTFGSKPHRIGTESNVYLSTTGLTVTKLNSAVKYDTWGEYIAAIYIHNALFPNESYILKGFTDLSGDLAAIVEQPVIRGSEAEFESVKDDMAKMGFRHIKENENPETPYDFINDKTGVIISDLHGENVIKDENGNLRYIDTVIRKNYIREFPASDPISGKVDDVVINFIDSQLWKEIAKENESDAIVEGDPLRHFEIPTTGDVIVQEAMATQLKRHPEYEPYVDDWIRMQDDMSLADANMRVLVDNIFATNDFDTALSYIIDVLYDRSMDAELPGVRSFLVNAVIDKLKYTNPLQAHMIMERIYGGQAGIAHSAYRMFGGLRSWADVSAKEESPLPYELRMQMNEFFSHGAAKKDVMNILGAVKGGKEIEDAIKKVQEANSRSKLTKEENEILAAMADDAQERLDYAMEDMQKVISEISKGERKMQKITANEKKLAKERAGKVSYKMMARRQAETMEQVFTKIKQTLSDVAKKCK